MFVILAVLYGSLTLALLPWAQVPGPRLPQVILVCNAGIALADLCTALLLGREFRNSGRTALLLLASAYLFSAFMALLHLSVFPGALFEQRLFGTAQTTSWMFLFWRIGTASAILAAVLHARREPLHVPAPVLARRLLTAGLATAGISLALAVLAARLEVPVQAGTQFTRTNLAFIWLYEILCGTALLLIWRSRAFGDTLYLWLALVLVASMTDQVLGSLSGGQYTLGWHAAKASSAISACMLLVFWLGHMTPQERAGGMRLAATYGAAFGAVLAALLLRWFVTPWLGAGYPFATLFGAIAIAVWMGGWLPAAVAAVLGYAAAVTFFVEPVGVLRIGNIADVFGSAMYFASCALIIGLGEAMRRARDRYRASEELFRRSQEAALQGFTLFTALRDKQGRVADLELRYVNPAGARHSRSAAEELVGRRASEGVPGAEGPEITAMLRNVVETGVPLDTEVRYHADGIEQWFRHLAVKIGDGVGTSYIDVTDNKRLEAELRHRAAELQRADSNKSQFLALLSHELRNPLAPLMNGLTLLKMRGDPETAAHTQAMMERQIHHLRRLIDDLLDVSRIDQGKLQLVRERVAIDAIVRNAIDTAKPGIEAKSHALVVRYAPEPLYVEGDAVRLSQVVANLLNNAAKFTPAGGRIEIATAAENGQAVVRIKDNGIGFAPGDEQRIFDMFVQLDGSRTQASGGLGLGLTLVRSLVEMHEGAVEAKSAGPGEGAEFTFRLPLASAPLERDSSIALPRATRAPRRVVVIDDNKDAADSLAQILRLEGFAARACYDGESGLAAMRDFEPDVAFVDLNMPGIDGIELTRRARAQPWGGRVRIVALTGMGQRSDIAATREAGFHAHLIKPANAEDVVRLASAERLALPRSQKPAASGGGT